MVPAASAGVAETIEGLQLTGVYPNPAHDNVTVAYVVAGPGEVTIEVFDVLGRHVRNVTIIYDAAGTHQLPIDTAGFAAGTYIVRITNGAGRSVSTRAVVLH